MFSEIATDMSCFLIFSIHMESNASKQPVNHPKSKNNPKSKNQILKNKNEESGKWIPQ